MKLNAKHFKDWQLIPGSAHHFPCVSIPYQNKHLSGNSKLCINEPNGSQSHVYEEIACVIAYAPRIALQLQLLVDTIDSSTAGPTGVLADEARELLKEMLG